MPAPTFLQNPRGGSPFSDMITVKIKKCWSREAPTKKGFYWFYGYASDFCKRMDSKRLTFMTVRGTNQGVCYIGDGEFRHPEEMHGWWRKLPNPGLPVGEKPNV